MVKELESLDVTDSPALLQLAQEVAETGIGRVLRTADGELAVLKPVSKSRKRVQRSRPMTKDDPFYKSIGIGRSGVPDSDASERKHEILARAYQPKA